MKKIFKKIALALNWTTETSAEEQLANFIKENKQTALINRIKSIRRNGDYIPNYNLPKVHTDIQILCQKTPNGDYEPISSVTKISCERPIDFGNDVKAWKKIVQIDHRKSVKEETKKAKQLQEFLEERQRNYNRAISPYMTVD